jgi:external thioesterase TEII
MQLFLLHFAGGNCYSFDFLKRNINNRNAEVHSLELPGRGKRIDERLIVDKNEAIRDYIAQIKKLRNREPYIIYGHSMGATLGISVVDQMGKDNDPPVKFVVSGNAGPGTEEKDEARVGIKWYLLPDEDFKVVLKELGGIPGEVIENKELFDFFAPIIRADFEILEKDQEFEQNVKIDTPIYAIMGDNEKLIEYIDNWKDYTTAHFKSRLLPGNHFFIYDHPGELANILLEN